MSRILVIDDDEPFRRMLRLTLSRLGHDVTEADNGRAALRQYDADPVELVICDLIMPEQEGIETIQTLRAQYPVVKIIAMSGGGRINARDLLVLARMLGADRTLTKPFSTRDLIQLIEQLLHSPPTEPALGQ